MLRMWRCFVFGLVLALAGAQTGPSADPKPTNAQNPSGSYSDFPGSLVNPDPTNTPNVRQGINNTSQDTNNVNKVQSNSGTINIPASSSSFSSFSGGTRPPKPPALSNNFNQVPGNPGPTNIPVESSSYSAASGGTPQPVPVSAIAAAELSQGITKSRPPLSTGTDTWTPMGHLGTGKQPWALPPPANNQELPYDPNQSKRTLGEQIMQQQQQQQPQQQQHQQQYDIFGFPINNSPGAVRGSNQGGFGGLGINQGGSGSSSGHGPGGELLQMMLMMQLLGGGDAPDPPPRGRGRGRGRGGPGGMLTPVSALEQLMRLEEIRMMRNRQRERVNVNRRLQNQRRGPVRQGRGPHGGQGHRQNRQAEASSSFDTGSNIPGPRPARPSSTVLRPGSPQSQFNTRPNRPPIAATNSFHPEVLDRRNMPTTPAPTQPGQEPVEREGQAGANQAGHGQSQSQPTPPPRDIVRRRMTNFNARRAPPTATPPTGNTFGYQSYNTFESPTQGQYHQQQYSPIGGQPFEQRNQRQNVPRNMQQLMRNPLFQRRLRVAGSTPGANPADVRADQADLMADRADNLQAMNPLQRMLRFGILGGLGGGQTGTGATGMSSALGRSPLSSLLGGGGGAGGLLALGMLGGMGI